MTAAGVLLKKIFQALPGNMHLLHNCAMKVRANYPAVDDLVARVIAMTIKNRSKRVFLLLLTNLRSQL